MTKAKTRKREKGVSIREFSAMAKRRGYSGTVALVGREKGKIYFRVDVNLPSEDVAAFRKSLGLGSNE